MSTRYRISRSWILVLLALVLCLVSVAVGVRHSVAPPSPPPSVEETGVADGGEASPVLPAPAPAPAPGAAENAREKPIALPPVKLPARNGANETAAIGTSRNVSSAQAQFQASAHVDEDKDGTGEFGTLAEMSSGVPIRGTSTRIIPAVLSSAFKSVDGAGRITRNGYVYAVFLPQRGGYGRAELGFGGMSSGVLDADLAETAWCMYAWPLEYGKTGNRTFMVNQFGDVVATDCASYSGANGPRPDAAFVPDPQTTSTILGKVAIGCPGSDGNKWNPVH